MAKRLFEKNSRALENIAKRTEDGKKEIIQKIDPFLIDEHPDNEYLFGIPREGIESLREAMRQNDGTVLCDAPIHVWKLANGRYMVYSGHLRRRAFIEAGGREIPAIVRREPDDEATKRRMLLGANLYGRNVNPVNAKDPVHTARQIDYMKKTLSMEGFEGNVREQLAKEFHTSESTIQRYLSFHNLPADIQQKVEDGEIPDTVAQAMGSMGRSDISKAEAALERARRNGKGALKRDEALRIVTDIKKGEASKPAAKTAEVLPDRRPEEHSSDKDMLRTYSAWIDQMELFLKRDFKKHKQDIDFAGKLRRIAAKANEIAAEIEGR